MDQEFDTICEDESIKEISKLLLKYLEMIKNNQLDIIKTELSQLSPCNNWIVPGNRINIIHDPEDDSDTDNSEDDEIEMNDNNFSITKNTSAPSTSGSTMQVEENDVDPGWTVVKKGKRRN